MSKRSRPESSLSPLWQSYVTDLEARLAAAVSDRETRARRLTRARKALRIEQARAATLEPELRQLQGIVTELQGSEVGPLSPAVANAPCAEPQPRTVATSTPEKRLVPLWRSPVGAPSAAVEDPAR